MSPKKDPRQQFSKWLARSYSVFLIAFLSSLLVAMCIRPEVSTACVYLALIVSVVAIIHVWAYTHNSEYEKGLLTLLDKTRMELTLRSGSDANKAPEKTPDEETEEGSNG